MHHMTAIGVRALRIALWAAVIAAPASVYAQTAKPAAPSATMPSGTMQRGAMGSADMKKSRCVTLAERPLPLPGRSLARRSGHCANGRI